MAPEAGKNRGSSSAPRLVTAKWAGPKEEALEEVAMGGGISDWGSRSPVQTHWGDSPTHIPLPHLLARTRHRSQLTRTRTAAGLRYVGIGAMIAARCSSCSSSRAGMSARLRVRREPRDQGVLTAVSGALKVARDARMEPQCPPQGRAPRSPSQQWRRSSAPNRHLLLRRLAAPSGGPKAAGNLSGAPRCCCCCC